MPRILLVEDEVVNREMFRRRLSGRGFTVLTAETGEQAVDLTAAERPDVVLMDLGLPGIDGWEATRRLKADPATKAIPVIALSAHATPEAKEKAFNAGCVEFETKPVQLDQLVTKITAVLGTANLPAPITPPPLPASRPPTATTAAAGVEAFDPGTPTFHGSPFQTAATPLQTPAIRKSGPPAFPAARPAGPGDTQVIPHAFTRPLPATSLATPTPGSKKRILVVEDNDANRVMLCRRLEKEGFLTVEARNGREAVKRVYEFPYDLVLLDIMMPEMDGYEVLKEVKADPNLKALPVIMISALDEMASVVRCIEGGAEDYLTKPYDPVLLQARINACLDKRRLRDQELAYLRAVTDLTRAAERVEHGEFDSELLAPVAARNDALGTLARVFDKMAREVQAREKQLRAEVERLNRVIVEIDPEKKRAELEQVSQKIADAGLDRKAEEMRKKRDERRAGRTARSTPSVADTMVFPKPPDPG